MHSAAACRSTSPVYAALALGLALASTSTTGLAETCASEFSGLRAGVAREVEYAVRRFDPGYRFSIDGLSWELVRTQITDAQGKQRFAVTYPVLIDASSSRASRDFYFSLQTIESQGMACNDVVFGDDSPVHRLRVDDDSNAVIRFGDLDSKAKHLESTRTLGTKLRIRIDGTEVVMATGFATSRRLNISRCASGFDDSFGFVEYQPGQVQVTCFPADPKNTDYVDEIDWHVDYQWPQDPPRIIDQLIDYVYVEPVSPGP